jgi:hypothetical protein
MAMLTWRKPVGAQTAAWIFIGAGIAVALVGIVQGVFIDRPTAIELGVVVPESILIAAIAYALGLRPLLVIDHRGIVVRNFLRTTPIPWSIFMGVSSERIGLVIHTAAVRQMVAAVPAGGRKVQGKQRAELIAHEVASYAADEVHLGTVQAFEIPPPVITGEERRRERIAWSVICLGLGGYVALMVKFNVTGH